ncbi:unnamed protein product [Chondrus crispus]|uniref:Uncharacterized protein n=1 Tax=Chondrus crispus TaxID=2769 RepID=R7QB97_CHOCR|nr:unnamed protein product [Chondrus crispus]CDF35018.1 unnamed protein product [Chondrus crispus]|eukprot:XP_005714837.1 unnamed protein product [Chondrus crispus]
MLWTVEYTDTRGCPGLGGAELSKNDLQLRHSRKLRNRPCITAESTNHSAVRYESRRTPIARAPPVGAPAWHLPQLKPPREHTTRVPGHAKARHDDRRGDALDATAADPCTAQGVRGRRGDAALCSRRDPAAVPRQPRRRRGQGPRHAQDGRRGDRLSAQQYRPGPAQRARKLPGRRHAHRRVAHQVRESPPRGAHPFFTADLLQYIDKGKQKKNKQKQTKKKKKRLLPAQ